MKVINREALIRRYHISLLVFLLALGLLPASLMEGTASADTERTSTERVIEPVETPREAEIVVSDTVETTDISEDLVINEPVYETPVYETQVSETTVYETPVSVAVSEPVYDQINIAGNTVPIFYSDNTLIDAGNQAALYGSHFIYGHNTANVFGGIANLGIGDYFTVTLSGVTRTYQIVNSDLQTKTHFEGETIHKTTTSGMTIFTRMRIMKAITAYGEYGGRYYDYILMTCAGTSYGNGDASHRLILMANEV